MICGLPVEILEDLLLWARGGPPAPLRGTGRGPWPPPPSATARGGCKPYCAPREQGSFSLPPSRPVCVSHRSEPEPRAGAPRTVPDVVPRASPRGRPLPRVAHAPCVSRWTCDGSRACTSSAGPPA